MAIRIIDDAKLQNIAVAIQAKDNGGQMTVDQMAGRIEAIPTGSPTVLNPALVLWDWEGTKLAGYSREDALALTELPAPDTLPPYAGIDHELLVFQNWTHNLLEIKAWVQSHYNASLDVNAIYMTSDALNHNYWGSPRLDDIKKINRQKRGSFVINNGEFQNYNQLTSISIPEGVTTIATNAFHGCLDLTHIGIPKSVTVIDNHAFAECRSLNKIVLPNNITDMKASSFNGCYALKRVELPAALSIMGESLFNSCYSLNKIAIPKNVQNIKSAAFYNCTALCDILIESLPTLTNTNALDGLPTNYYIYVPRENLSWFETETNWATIYTQGHIVAIEDYIEYLESIGFNVDKYK